MAKNSSVSEDTKTIVTVLLLLFAYPIGFFLMWFWPKWPSWVKILISLPIILVFLLLFLLIILALSGKEIKEKNLLWQDRAYQLITPAPFFSSKKLSTI